MKKTIKYFAPECETINIESKDGVLTGMSAGGELEAPELGWLPPVSVPEAVFPIL